MTKIEEVNPHLKKELSQLFKTYKDLQNKKEEDGESRNEKEAKKDILKSFELFDNSKK
jgi:inorganic pyrophosphatase